MSVTSLELGVYVAVPKATCVQVEPSGDSSQATSNELGAG